MKHGRRHVLAANCVSLALAGVVSTGEAHADERPKSVAALLDCRSVADNAARLQCYDRATAGLAAAGQSGDLLILDGKKVVAVRRQSFGLAPTRVRAPATTESRQLAELRQIDSTIVAVRPTSYGRYLMSLANGGAWETAEPVSFPPPVKAPIRIVKAGFGGFRATAGKGHSFLVKRIG